MAEERRVGRDPLVHPVHRGIDEFVVGTTVADFEHFDLRDRRRRANIAMSPSCAFIPSIDPGLSAPSKRPLRRRAEALILGWGAVIVGAAAGGGITTGMKGNMANFGGIAGDQLKSLIERIERLEEEKRALGEDIKEVYAEAKGTGFEPKIMRQLIKIRKMDKNEHDEQESLLDVYKRAIGMLPEAGPSAQAAE